MMKREIYFLAGVVFFLSSYTAYNQKVLYPEKNPLNVRFDNFLIMNGKDSLAPEKNRYRYFMTGIDKDTVEPGSGLFAEYKKMTSGKFKFWVTGSNNDVVWNPEGVSLEIRIHPPWYKSVLAYLIYGLLFIVLIAVYIRLRIYRLTKDKEKLEAEIKVHTKELEIKNRKLEEIDRIKAQFFTDISHEIRTPLSLIIDPLDKMSKELVLDEKMQSMIDMMKRNGQRILQLVNQLLDISKLDAGKMIITLAEDDIIRCLRILVYEFLSLAENKRIKYVADLPEKEFITWFDRDKIEKIISNLLSNAFKFTQENGTVQCIIKIETGIKENPQHYLKITVTDSGMGIDKEHIDKIFNRFYRINSRFETDNRGTGIGLSITREFVTLLHGEIKVNSNPGSGSEFIISIPLGKDHLSPDEYVISKAVVTTDEKPFKVRVKREPELLVKTQDGINQLKILIIEDNIDLRNYISDNFAEDYYVIGADNGRTGVNMAFTMMPDIIVTDIMMPDLDGIALCRQLKNDERTSHIPIIMLTARTTVDDKIEGLRSGADAYIIKPFNMAELKIQILNLLDLREKLKLKYSSFQRFITGEVKLKSVDDMFIDKVIKLIKENLRDFDFDVKVMKERLGMSRMHLYRKLKVLTGLSPSILIREIRLEKAAELLLNKAGNITEIANSVGISNPSYFTRVFSTYFGVSPKNYRK